MALVYEFLLLLSKVVFFFFGETFSFFFNQLNRLINKSMSVSKIPSSHQIPGLPNESDPIFAHGSQGSINERLPLFGDSTSQRDRVLSIGLAVACTSLIFVLTGNVFFKLNIINVIALFTIFSISGSHAILIYWYRLGDLDPKFRMLLIWNSLNLVVMCIIILIYYHSV